MLKSELIDIAVCVHGSTPKAIRVSTNGEDKDAVWLPRSVIEIERKPGSDLAGITLPRRMAEDKGLV